MSKVWSICVSYRDEEFDPLGRRTAWEIQDMGISGVGGVKTVQVFQLVGRLDEGEVRMLCEELLHDPIIQQYSYIEGIDASPLFKASNTWSVEVKLKPGVFDSLAESVFKGAEVIGIHSIERVETYMVYLVRGNLSYEKVELLCRRCLANPIIHNYKIHPPLNSNG
ncbi:phosphoribosylformylglycinamidine synthase subunit PurS [Candidatus Bathyarchaeota archaeon]|nr:phosphoribosylformylglycinamidine synthase subunit PurS [Candidatus Bathyarchaeota archaeon]MBS7612719.1 phosphoribosylformylglycinamidine synthase subunit PurS [Candidatus Bathyarchaeota archaeon]MBS7617762.1 phosphoribosylformylglycinamidine synthase subunit PurS [Candidatus Bathyarchaeota archaeon]